MNSFVGSRGVRAERSGVGCKHPTTGSDYDVEEVRRVGLRAVAREELRS
jgi:hypothetical protein